MKRYIRTRTIFLGALASGTMLLTACLKDTGPVQDYSQSPPVISFQTNGQGANAATVTVPVSSSQSSPSVDSVELSLGVASLYLKTPVNVTVAAVQATLDSFNNANGTSFTLLPSTAYSIQGGGAITIPAGTNLVNFAVSFYGNAIDNAHQYALPLTITGASGGNSIVASNLNQFVLVVQLQ